MKKLTAEEKIMQGWGNRVIKICSNALPINKKESLSWMDFKKVLCKVLECAPPILEKLKYTLGIIDLYLRCNLRSDGR